MATTNLVIKSIGDIAFEHGNGTPDHVSAKGTLYIDLDTAIPYYNNNGGTGWDKHNALSDAQANKLGFISVTQAVNLDTMETDISNAIPNSEKGAINGVATLDGSGKIPTSQLPTKLMEYEGDWAASTNTPTLANTDTDLKGTVYKVTDAGTVDFGAGNITFAAGDWVYNNGTTWEKQDNTDQVTSVNTQTGAVVLDTGDVDEVVDRRYMTDAQESKLDAIVSKTSSNVATTDATITEIDKIDDLTAEASHFIDVYVACKSSDDTEHGTWHFSLCVTKLGGAAVVQLEDTISHRSTSGLNAQSVTFSANAGDIDIDVTGIAAKNIQWNAVYCIVVTATN